MCICYAPIMWMHELYSPKPELKVTVHDLYYSMVL